MPGYAVELYVDTLKSSRDALRASFDYYRAIDEIIEQSQRRKQRKVTLPVLSIAGGASIGEGMEEEVRIIAEDVTALVILGCGHYVPEEAPEAMLEAVNPFLAPYRDAFQQ